MLKYNKKEISSLSDVFAAWMGGYPENDSEIRTFLQKTELNIIMSTDDVNSVINNAAYFPELLVPIAYGCIPLKIKIKDKEHFVSPEEFNKFNKRVMQSPDLVHSLNISFRSALIAKEKFFEAKQVVVAKEKSRIINAKYRKVHKEEIAEKFKERREKAKSEDIEALREADKANNSNPNRKETCKNYYKKHKEEIAEKARNNPNTKAIKKRFKAKQRFKTKTGPKILSLLHGIANSKTER